MNYINFNFIRFTAKVAIVGGAVYLTVNNNIWNKTDYAEQAINNVKKSMPDTVELFKQVSVFVIKLISIKFKLDLFP